VGWGVERVGVKAVRDILSIALSTVVFVVVFAVVIGLVFLVRGQLEAAGLQWPSALDTALSALVGFIRLVMMLDDIVVLVALIIILFALGVVFREAGR
jgi:Na+-driven multidrug efflux pump